MPHAFRRAISIVIDHYKRKGLLSLTTVSLRRCGYDLGLIFDKAILGAMLHCCSSRSLSIVLYGIEHVDDANSYKLKSGCHYINYSDIVSELPWFIGERGGMYCCQNK